MAAEMGYCVKCREKREMKDTKEVSMKGDRRALKGVCVKCGTKMFRILGKKRNTIPCKNTSYAPNSWDFLRNTKAK